jgi:hypothetical protein
MSRYDAWEYFPTSGCCTCTFFGTPVLQLNGHKVDALAVLGWVAHTAHFYHIALACIQECVENLFLSLCATLQTRSNQQRFLDCEGFELLMRCLKEQQYAAGRIFFICLCNQISFSYE